ncbi:MAG: L-aspartate oxidase [Caulobacteraceae bacterium]
MTDKVHLDGVLIVGAGLAGLTAALAAAPRRTMVLSPVPLGEGCASSWAQGGMAAALGDDDDPALHAADTIAAGAGLCDPAAVAILTREGPAAVRALAALGAPFDRTAGGDFVQSLEAAHSRARIARVGGDGAGLAIMRAVIGKVRESEHIEAREDARATALIQDGFGRVLGALAEIDGRTVEIRAAATVLATGGLGGLYAVTTNPPIARGDGLALAWLAGAEIVDPEFVQFHPTAIDTGADPAPLATEALRGEGARLIDGAGRPFMDRYHAAGDLAPRDVVARAIAAESVGGRRVFLDATKTIGEAFPEHFPAVFAACRAAGLDPRISPIPVKPAAHYHMGGVAADAWGRTSLPGLFAVGEVASSGVHGANRLASNSLLEAAVFGRRAGEAAREAGACGTRGLPVESAPDMRAEALVELRRRMSADAGVVRTAEGLAALVGWLDGQLLAHGPALPVIAARLVAEAALARRESRGAHFRTDFPTPLAEGIHSTLRRTRAPEVRAA